METFLKYALRLLWSFKTLLVVLIFLFVGYPGRELNLEIRRTTNLTTLTSNMSWTNLSENNSTNSLFEAGWYCPYPYHIQNWITCTTQLKVRWNLYPNIQIFCIPICTTNCMKMDPRTSFFFSKISLKRLVCGGNSPHLPKKYLRGNFFPARLPKI